MLKRSKYYLLSILIVILLCSIALGTVFTFFVETTYEFILPPELGYKPDSAHPTDPDFHNAETWITCEDYIVTVTDISSRTYSDGLYIKNMQLAGPKTVTFTNILSDPEVMTLEMNVNVDQTGTFANWQYGLTEWTLDPGEFIKVKYQIHFAEHAMSGAYSAIMTIE